MCVTGSAKANYVKILLRALNTSDFLAVFNRYHIDHHIGHQPIAIAGIRPVMMIRVRIDIAMICIRLQIMHAH